ncbi:MAG: choice-of-anchor D domain-containing protein [Vicinamibacterales bacterium]
MLRCLRVSRFVAARRALAALLALVFCGGASLTAALEPPSANHWHTTGSLEAARAGAAATLLFDGRVLVTGGLGAGGDVLPSAERYSPEERTFTAVAPMAEPRAYHTATLLSDGRVLVAGGIDASGAALASAEIYDPSSNTWQPSAPMHHARAGHTATALYDGRVVVVGGRDGAATLASIEVFDPWNLEGRFDLAPAALSAPRSGHAAALTYADTVVVAGGSDGASLLSSIDVFDPLSGAVAAATPLTTARAGLTATTLLDGRILLLGGAGESGELASGEIYDPALDAIAPTGNDLSAPRQHHHALLLPHNSQVLIVGGTAGPQGAAVGTAEVYVAWQGEGGTFYAADPPGTARAWGVAAALSFPPGLTIRSGPHDGLALLAGGSSAADGEAPLSSSELYGFATVITDKADYGPGQTVTISGAGWAPGETVTLTLAEDPPTDLHVLQPVVAADDGTITSTEFKPDWGDVGVRFYLTATGGVSQAQTSFTDAAKTWTGAGTDDNWTTGGNWQGGVAPVAGDALTFPSGAARLSNTNDFADGTAFSISLTGDGYTLAGNSVSLTGGSVLDASTSGTNTISLVFTGTGTLTKNGSGGTLSLSGASTYSGGTTLTAGTLQFDASSTGAVTNGPVGTGTLTIEGGTIRPATTARTVANPLTFGGDFTIAGTVALTMSGDVTVTGDRTVTLANGTQNGIVLSGAIDADSSVNDRVLTFDGAPGDLLLDSGSVGASQPLKSFVVAGTHKAVLGPVTLNGASGSTIDVTVDQILLANGNLTSNNGAISLSSTGGISGGSYNGVGIGGSGAVTVSAGTGAILLSGIAGTTTGNGVLIQNGSIVQTTSGDITITGAGSAGSNATAGVRIDGSGSRVTSQSGSISITGTGAGSGTGTAVNNRGIFIVNSAAVTSTGAATITLDGRRVSGTSGAAIDTQGTTTLGGGSGDITIIATSGSTAVLAGVISGSGALVKQGTVQVNLSGANTYTGATTITAGTLALGAADSVPSGSAVTVTSTFDLAGFSDEIGSLAGGGTVTSSVAGAVTLTAGGDNTSTTFTGVIQDGSGTVSLTKAGTGELLLSGANTYTGTTTVSAGVLRVNSSQPTSAVSLNGGSLRGAGSVGAVTSTASSGTVAPGSSANTATLGSGAIDWSTGAPTFSVRLDGANAGTEYDQLAVTGTVNLTGAALSVALGYAPTTGSSYRILDNDAADAITGTFAGLAEGATFTSGGYTFQISYVGGTGNDVVLTNLAGIPTKLGFDTQPSAIVAGSVIAPAVTVRVLDDDDNLVSSDYATKVTLAIGNNPGSGTLAGGGEVTVSAGVATFAGLSIDKAGNGYTLLASDTTGGGGVHPLTGDTSAAFDVTPNVTFSPAALVFDPQLPDLLATQDVTVTYLGSGSMTIASIATDDLRFTVESDDCPASLSTNDSCTVTVGFEPPFTMSGASYSGHLIVSHDAAGSPHQIDLSGERTWFHPISFDVGFVPVGRTSAIKQFKIYNVGSEAMITTASAVSITPATFAIVGESCSGRPILPYAGNPNDSDTYCLLQVEYSPAVSGQVQATVVVTDTNGRTHEVRVKATGSLNLAASPASLGFGSVPTGTSSAIKTVTLSNASGIAVDLTSIDVAGAGFARTGGSCDTVLGAQSTCTIDLQLTPSAGPASGTLTIVNSSDADPLIVPLSGSGSFSMKVGSAVAFGRVARGIPGAVKTLTVTNSNAAAIPLTSLEVTAGGSDFAITGGSCATEVPASGSCTIELQMTPSAAGARTGALTITSEATGSPHVVALSGVGTFDLKVSAAAVSFGTAGIGVPVVKVITLTNVNGVAVNVSSDVSAGGSDFSITGGTCGAVVPAKVGLVNGTCTIELTFAGSETGARSGTLTITSDADNGPHAVALSGSATQTMTLSAGSLGFPATPVGITSATRTVTLRNPNGVPVTINSIAVTLGAAEFARIGGTCGASVPARIGSVLGTCTVDLAMTATAAGVRAGTLTVDVDASGGPFTVDLSGTATFALKVSAAAINFGTVAVGATGGTKTVTLTNVNGVPIALTAIPLGAIDSSGFVRTGGSCDTSVPAKVGIVNGTCTITLALAPVAAGPQAATLTIESAASDSPHAVSLSGNATLPLTFSRSSFNFGNKAVSSTTSLTVTVTNATTVDASNLAVSLSGSTPPDFAIGAGTTCGSALPANSSCAVSIDFSPSSTGTLSGQLIVDWDDRPSVKAMGLSGKGI